MKSFCQFQHRIILDDTSDIADGDYILEDLTVRIKDGYLNDIEDEEGRTLPAIEMHDGTHIEHWKNGVLHCESEPAVIDSKDGYEEWWLEGKQVQPESKN